MTNSSRCPLKDKDKKVTSREAKILSLERDIKNKATMMDDLDTAIQKKQEKFDNVYDNMPGKEAMRKLSLLDRHPRYEKSFSEKFFDAFYGVLRKPFIAQMQRLLAEIQEMEQRRDQLSEQLCKTKQNLALQYQSDKDSDDETSIASTQSAVQEEIASHLGIFSSKTGYCTFELCINLAILLVAVVHASLALHLDVADLETE